MIGSIKHVTLILLTVVLAYCQNDRLDLAGKTITISFTQSANPADFKSDQMLVDFPEKLRRAIHREVAQGMHVNPQTRLAVTKVDGDGYLNYKVTTNHPIAKKNLAEIKTKIKNGIGQSRGEVLFEDTTKQ